MIYKGTESDIDAYSSFFDNQRLKETKLRHELTKRGVTDVYVAGIATDVCVGKYRVSKTNFLQEIQVLKIKPYNLSFLSPKNGPGHLLVSKKIGERKEKSTNEFLGILELRNILFKVVFI